MSSRRYMLVMLFITMSLSEFCHGQSSQQEQTLAVLRHFQDELDKSPASEAISSLQRQMNDVISLAKSTDDARKLTSLQKYFANSEQTLRDANTSSGKQIVAKHIGDDLKLKLAATDSSRNLPTSIFFGKSFSMTVNALVSGARPSGVFRLYWAVFNAPTQEAVIRSGRYGGFSPLFANPYKVDIWLPGIITFWLQNTTTHEVYKSDVEYLRIAGPSPDKLDINFIKMP